MAQPETDTQAAQKRQQAIEEKTSFGRYMLKQLQTTGIPLIGAAIGFFGSKGLLKNDKIRAWASAKMPLQELFSSQTVFTAIGTFFTMTIATIFNTYEHWKNLEQEKLAVGEINTDVGHLVEERAKFAQTLNRQETVIKQLLAEREQSAGFGERVTSQTTSAEMTRH